MHIVGKVVGLHTCGLYNDFNLKTTWLENSQTQECTHHFISRQPGIKCQGSDLAYSFNCIRGPGLSSSGPIGISKLETFACEQKGMSRFPFKLKHSLKEYTLTWSCFESFPLEIGYGPSQSLHLGHPAAISWHLMMWDGVEATPTPGHWSK